MMMMMMMTDTFMTGETQDHKTHTDIHNTRRIAVYLGTHCNIGSKRAFPGGVLDRWHNCLIIY